MKRTTAWLPLEASGQVRIDVIPGASHYSWIDNPAAFDGAFRTALSLIDGGTGLHGKQECADGNLWNRPD